MASHRLLTADPVTRTGTCSECGTTPLAKKGARWRCATANRGRVSAWKQAKPGKAEGQRGRWRNRQVGRLRPHQLISKDMVTLTGECRDCGPITITRVGRGWSCFAAAGVGCPCDDIRWYYVLADVSLCELCCYALARGFVQQGLLEPVLELTWPDNRVSWDTAVYELEAA